MRLHYSIRGLLLTTTILAVAFGVLLSFPNSKTIPLFDGNVTTAHFRGFAYSTARVYRLEIRPYDTAKGHWQVEFTKPGSNPFTRYDRNGKLSERGECNVNVWGEWIWVEFDDAGNPIGNNAQ